MYNITKHIVFGRIWTPPNRIDYNEYENETGPFHLSNIITYIMTLSVQRTLSNLE